MRRHASPAAQRGALMIEVLVTIVICVIGLWGLTKVQSRLQMSEVESYQRSQALMLMELRLRWLVLLILILLENLRELLQ